MSSGPSVPDPTKVSNAQTQSNIQTATAQTGLNSANQVTPFGNLSYSQIGTWPDGTPRFQATTTLSPQLQGLFSTGVGTQQQIGNTAQSLAGRLGNSLSQPINSPQLQTSVGNFDAVRQQTQDALLGRLNQQSDRDLGSLQQQLANQGIQQGSQAYTNAMKDFNEGLSANRMNALLAANTAQGQAQDLAMGSANFGNNAQQQQYTNQLTGRNQNINELLSLLGGSQINQPSFSQTPQTGINGTDVGGNAWNAYQANQNQSNQFWNGVGSLGATAASFLPYVFSDERLKTDIRDTGMKTPGGVPIKDWRYKGSPMMQRGFIAQDVQKKQPGAVARIPTPKGGFLAVQYGNVR